MSFWLDNGMAGAGKGAQPKHTIVDCGYADVPAACDAVLELARVFGKSHKRRRNAELVGSNRLVFRVPPHRVGELASMPQVREGGCYCWTTHRFGDGPQFALPGQRKSADAVDPVAASQAPTSTRDDSLSVSRETRSTKD